MGEEKECYQRSMKTKATYSKAQTLAMAETMNPGLGLWPRLWGGPQTLTY